ncbi:zincin-like metallopeptidase domain-containing protein [Nitrospira sp. BLG_2]|uniref:zincin-like metallopeptidase domain-containing protein n=1 Tax=Nitrospira sp. BLG_2 TaxID=3397507 RepID=UPI003B9C14FA
MTRSLNDSIMLRRGINKRIIRALEDRILPWQKPWVGHGEGVGYPREVGTGKKFFGINFLLLQMAAREHGFTSSWWGTAKQFELLGTRVRNRPDSVPLGNWSTETILYKNDIGNVITVSSIVYNTDQLGQSLIQYSPNPRITPFYEQAERVLHSTGAKIKHNSDREAYYFYPPHDFITIPTKACFEAGWGGLPGYYESLAHELLHWTETRLRVNTEFDESIRELRADIGAAMLVEELGVPHSISYSNFDKWYRQWISLMHEDENIIFRVCASASRAVDYILDSKELRFNQINEYAA